MMQILGQHILQACVSAAETAGTYSGVLEERAAKGALVPNEAELATEEQSDMGSFTGWQALADQVCPQPCKLLLRARHWKPFLRPFGGHREKTQSVLPCPWR